MKRFLLLFGFIIINLSVFGQATETLSGSFVAPSTGHITWVRNIYSAAIEHYQIDYRVQGAATWSHSPVIDTTARAWDHTGLVVGTTYEYKLMRDIQVTPGSHMWLGPTNAEVTITVPAAKPATPSNCAVSNIKTTTATVTWTDNSNNETGFDILVNDVKVGFVGPNVTTFNLTGLSAYSDIFVKVIALNTGGYSNPSNTVGFRTLKELPRPPKNLAVSSYCANSVNMYWIDDSYGAGEEDTFIIERSTDGNNFSQIDTRGRNVVLYTDNTVADGVTYWYRVRGINNAGLGYPSNVMVVTTKGYVVPLAPYNAKAYASGYPQGESTITIDWSNNLEDYDCRTNIRTGQEIWYNIDGNAWMFLATVGRDASTYTASGLDIATNYNFRIAATNAKGRSAYSNVAYARTLGTKPPTNLVATGGVDAAGNTIATLTWKDNADNEDRFYIESSMDSVNFTQIAIIKNNLTSFTLAPVEEGVNYFYRIRSSYQYGHSKYSNITKLFIDFTKAPKAPFDLKAALSNGKVALTWQDDSQREAGFEVERSADNKTFTKIATTGINAVAFVDTNNATGYYRVRAVNTKGNSDYSNVASIMAAKAAVTNPVSFAKEMVDVYPNPTVDFVRVAVPEAIQQDNVKITVFDGMNRIVSSVQLRKGATEHTVDLSNMTEGAYTVIISTDTQKISKKVYKY